MGLFPAAIPALPSFLLGGGASLEAVLLKEFGNHLPDLRGKVADEPEAQQAETGRYQAASDSWLFGLLAVAVDFESGRRFGEFPTLGISLFSAAIPVLPGFLLGVNLPAALAPALFKTFLAALVVTLSKALLQSPLEAVLLEKFGNHLPDLRGKVADEPEAQQAETGRYQPGDQGFGESVSPAAEIRQPLTRGLSQLFRKLPPGFGPQDQAKGDDYRDEPFGA